MPFYALVRDGRVWTVVEAPRNPYGQTSLDIRDVTGLDPMPQQGWRDVAGVLTPPPASPATPTPLSRLQFLTRFTEAEQVAVEIAKESHPTAAVRAALKVIDRMVLTATDIHLDDPRTMGGVQRLVTFGLLTPARATEILTP